MRHLMNLEEGMDAWAVPIGDPHDDGSADVRGPASALPQALGVCSVAEAPVMASTLPTERSVQYMPFP